MTLLLQLLSAFGTSNTELDLTGDGFISIHDILMALDILF
jgi:hypothetical protein